MERKILEANLQIKQLRPSGIFAGYGSVFGVRDRMGEVVDRGAFSRSLDAHRTNGTTPALLLHHDHQRPVGRFEKILDRRRLAAGREAKTARENGDVEI